jgi:prophage regulatory protein
MQTDRYVRVRQIVGDPEAVPPIPAILQVGASTWWAWVKEGKAPQPIKLSPRVTVWRESEVRAFVERLGAGQ